MKIKNKVLQKWAGWAEVAVDEEAYQRFLEEAPKRHPKYTQEECEAWAAYNAKHHPGHSTAAIIEKANNRLILMAKLSIVFSAIATIANIALQIWHATR